MRRALTPLAPDRRHRLRSHEQRRVRAEAVDSQFGVDVARDLSAAPKRLSSQYLYDELGSTLFEAICRLPWYRITRAEGALLARHAPEIIGRVTGDSDDAPAIIELGVGSGEKLALLVEAMPEPAGAALHLVDISASALAAASARFEGIPDLRVTGYENTYEEGLLAAARASDRAGRRLVAFLGSNIGNFDGTGASALLRHVRHAVRAGDLLLLGADLVKPVPELLRAYDDPLGVTAAFNMNLLVRLNRELDATFDLSAFEHRAVWNAARSRIEMHLASRVAQQVDIPGAGIRIHFAAGETIWTESSYKYSEEKIAALGAGAGFAVVERWIDRDAGFALTLFEAS